MRKQLAKILIISCMMLSLFLVMLVTAEAEILSSGTCGDNLTWTLDSQGTLTISGTGDMWDYSGYDTPWYFMDENCSGSVKSVVIEEGITSIGNSAFYGESVETVNMPDSIKRIGKYAFAYGGGRLSSVNIPYGVTKIEEGTFLYSSLKSVTIPDSVTEIGDSAFAFCFQLKDNITIPDSVSVIGDGAFYACGRVKSVTMPKNAEYIGDNAFEDCDFTSFTIPDGVTTIKGNTFLGCENLKIISIPSSVTTIEDFVFGWVLELSDIYYGGSAQEWNELISDVDLGYNDSNLTIHYNCKYMSNMTKIMCSDSKTVVHIIPFDEFIGSTVVFALYEEGMLVDVKTVEYSGGTIEIVVDKKYDEIKMMVWNDLSTIRPLCKAEIFNEFDGE